MRIQHLQKKSECGGRLARFFKMLFAQFGSRPLERVPMVFLFAMCHWDSPGAGGLLPEPGEYLALSGRAGSERIRRKRVEVCRISGIMCCCEERGFRADVAGIYSGIRVSPLFQFGTPPVFGKECGADGVRRSPSEETALSQELFCTLVPSAGQPHAVCALHIFRGCHGKRRVPSARRAIRALAWRGDAVTLIICVYDAHSERHGGACGLL